MEVQGLADPPMALSSHHRVGSVERPAGLLGVHAAGQHAWGELPVLADDTANGVGEALGVHPVHHHGADGHKALMAGPLRLKIHGADETIPLIGAGGDGGT